jgi:hypothetical protein
MRVSRHLLLLVVMTASLACGDDAPGGGGDAGSNGEGEPSWSATYELRGTMQSLSGNVITLDAEEDMGVTFFTINLLTNPSGTGPSIRLTRIDDVDEGTLSDQLRLELTSGDPESCSRPGEPDHRFTGGGFQRRDLRFGVRCTPASWSPNRHIDLRTDRKTTGSQPTSTVVARSCSSILHGSRCARC